MKKPGFVLDSFAVLAYFQAEPGGLKVKELLRQASKGSVLMYLSHLNLGEIMYITERRLGNDTASHTLEDIMRLPIQLVAPGMERVLAAAHVRAHHLISYADAFVVSLAQELKATIITSDPEFKKVEPLANILWLQD